MAQFRVPPAVTGHQTFNHTFCTSVASSPLARPCHLQGHNMLQNDGSVSVQTEEVSQEHDFSRLSL